MGGVQIQVLMAPVAAAENEFLEVAHGLHRVRGKAVRFRHFQNFGDLESRLIVEPVAPAVAESGQIAFGTKYRHVHVFALGISN